MSLDKNLFTLIFTQNKDHLDVTDLVDPSGTVHYHKRKVAGAEYKIEVYDPLSEAHLITATAPSASSKVKTLELHNPTSVVEIKYTGTLSFKWSFQWEQHEFEWKREQCFLIRKPDPPVLVAVTKEPTGRLKTHQVQILDYNINRFDIEDRKGLQIVILTALMTFHDANDAYHEAPSPSSKPPVSRNSSLPDTPSASETLPPPPPPPKPAPKTGVDRVAELQAQIGDYNEIIVDEEGSVQDYGAYCSNLLQDDAMLFITVKSSSAQMVPKVLQVVEETRRIRHKAGLDEDEQLYQYVLHDAEKRKGPRRIDLNDDADKKARYAPPSNLTIHLSKIDMPELHPMSPDKGKKKDDKYARPAPSVPLPPVPSHFSAPVNVSRPSSSSVQKQKPPKNKLARPPRDKDKTSESMSPSQSQYQPNSVPPSPPTGILNSGLPRQPPPPSSSRPPAFPTPQHSIGGGPETPGLGLYNSFISHSPPFNSQNHSSHNRPASMMYQQPPPPPPPASLGQYTSHSNTPPGGSKPQSMSAITSVAQTVVSGIFDKLNRR